MRLDLIWCSCAVLLFVLMENKSETLWAVFAQAALKVYRGWNALQYALDQDLAEVGETKLGERMAEMHDEVLDFFRRYGDSASVEEVSDFFHIVLAEDFNIELDDGSDTSVATLLIKLFQDIVQKGDSATPLLASIERYAAGFLPGIDPPEEKARRQKREYRTIVLDENGKCIGEENGCDDDDNGGDSYSDSEEEGSLSCSSEHEVMDGADEVENNDDKKDDKDDKDNDDDGWTVAGSRKKRKGKK